MSFCLLRQRPSTVAHCPQALCYCMCLTLTVATYESTLLTPSPSPLTHLTNYPYLATHPKHGLDELTNSSARTSLLAPPLPSLPSLPPATLLAACLGKP